MPDDFQQALIGQSSQNTTDSPPDEFANALIGDGQPSYVVKPGDNLTKIANQMGTTIQDLTGYRSGDPNLIHPGEQIRSKSRLGGGLTLPGDSQATILGAPGTLGTPALAHQAADVFSGGINRGRDVEVPTGTSIAAPPGEWVVQDAFGSDAQVGRIGDGTNNGYGNSVLLKNKATGETLRMSHLSMGVHVRPGQTIAGGTPLGQTGVTGNTSGPHLDIEVTNPQGQLIDVMNSPYARYLMPS